jgi:hypothetical protein
MQPQRFLGNVLLFVASFVAISNAGDTSVAARCVSLADTDIATLLTLHSVLQAHLKPPSQSLQPEVVWLESSQKQPMVDNRNPLAEMHRTAGQHRRSGRHHEGTDR